MAHDVFERKHEILTVGDGLAAWAAAVTAARAGRKVLLAARRPNLGLRPNPALELRPTRRRRSSTES